MRKTTLVLLLRLALFVAVFASAVLFVEYQNAGDPAFCGVGSGCMAVRMSSYSRVAGVPLPVIGLAGFSMLFVFALLARERSHFQYLAALTLAGAAVAVLLIIVQAVEIKAFCKWCIFVDVGAIVAAIAAVLINVDVGKGPENEEAYAAFGAHGLTVGAWLIGAGIAAGLPFLWAEYPVVPPLPESIAALQVKGKVTIVSFTDFQCPHCRALHPLLRQIEELDADRVVLVRKMVPLPGHPGAMPAALGYLCVPEAKRDDMAHLLYELPATLLTREGVITVGAGLGVDHKAMEQCVDSPRTKELLQQDIALFDGLAAKALPLTFAGPRVVMGNNPVGVRGAVAKALQGEQPALPVSWMLALVAAIAAGLVLTTWRFAPRPGGAPSGPAEA